MIQSVWKNLTVAIKLEAHNSLEYIICLNIKICTHENY